MHIKQYIFKFMSIYCLEKNIFYILGLQDMEKCNNSCMYYIEDKGKSTRSVLSSRFKARKEWGIKYAWVFFFLSKALPNHSN